MCKHKSGGNRSQQSAASSSSSETKVEPLSMGTSQEYQVEGAKCRDEHEICIAAVPVHHAASPVIENRRSLSKPEMVNVDECNETSPMLVSNEQANAATCALPNINQTNYMDSSEEDVLLHLGESAYIGTQNDQLAIECDGKSDMSRKYNQWRCGMVVCSSVRSLNGDSKEDVCSCNSRLECTYDQIAATSESAMDRAEAYRWKRRMKEYYERHKSSSLPYVGCSNEIPTCSSSAEQERPAPNMPLAITQSPFPQHRLIKGLHCSPSIASNLTEGGNMPMCKICHMPSTNGDPLISPCRCAGTMQYIHYNCLMKWLLYSNRRSRRPPTCELCQYQYHWHKKFKVGGWQFPRCSPRDKMYHLTFILAVIIMVASATITILCFSEDKGIRANHDSAELTDSEIITLACGVLFFVAFFLALYVEVKARINVYRLCLKFLYLNQQWYFDEYEEKSHTIASV